MYRSVKNGIISQSTVKMNNIITNLPVAMARKVKDSPLIPFEIQFDLAFRCGYWRILPKQNPQLTANTDYILHQFRHMQKITKIKMKWSEKNMKFMKTVAIALNIPISIVIVCVLYAWTENKRKSNQQTVRVRNNERIPNSDS